MKFLASDFDNTIYFLDDEEKNYQNVEAIRKFVSEGNIFCIITGRNYTDLKKYLTKYHIPYHYLVCEDGAKLFDGNDECFDTTYLDVEDIKKIVGILKKEKWNYYLDNGYQKTDSYEDCVKVVVECSNDSEKERIVNFIQKKLNVHIYASRFHVNIINQSVNKKNALEKLIQIKSIDSHLVHVIGDNDNDYEMLENFNGVVIKKHHPILNRLSRAEVNTIKDYIEELMK